MKHTEIVRKIGSTLNDGVGLFDEDSLAFAAEAEAISKAHALLEDAGLDVRLLEVQPRRATARFSLRYRDGDLDGTDAIRRPFDLVAPGDPRLTASEIEAQERSR